MKNYLLILIIPVFFAVSCKTDDTPVPDSYYARSWLPLKKGNTWTYIQNNNIKDTVTMKVNGDAMPQDLEIFYGIENYMDGETYFSQYDDHTYYMMLSPGMNTNFTTPILDDSMPEGYSATTEDTFAYPTDLNPPLAIFTIEEKNISKTVNGKTYNHVIHTSVDVEMVLSDDYSNLVTYDLYFARGIGLIEIDKSELGYVTDKRSLISYHIQ